jgi:hypothetical protein
MWPLPLRAAAAGRALDVRHAPQGEGVGVQLETTLSLFGQMLDDHGPILSALHITSMSAVTWSELNRSPHASLRMAESIST